MPNLLNINYGQHPSIVIQRKSSTIGPAILNASSLPIARLSVKFGHLARAMEEIHCWEKLVFIQFPYFFPINFLTHHLMSRNALP
jgi:hypothetical protein